MSFIIVTVFLLLVNNAVTFTLFEKSDLCNILPRTGQSFMNLKCDSDNPDVYLSTEQIIARHGYPAESHIIQTKDGYLLTLHRIPYSKSSSTRISGQPIFLQHGLLGASTDWVIAGNKSLAFILSDAGYDVWLGNARGNMYSRAHVSYTPNDAQFWDFSWDEMGMFDLPSALSFVSNYTQKAGEIIYIGHSMGTTMFFVHSSIHKNVSKNVKMMVALAPVAYMSDVRSPIRYLAPWTDDIEWLTKYLGLNEFLPTSKIIKFLAAVGCEKTTAEMNLCEDIIFLLAGFDKEEFDTKLLPVVLSHEPAGTSTKTVIHYAQEIKSSGTFSAYDYGIHGNIEHYGTKCPPEYNVTDINVPIYLMSSNNDWLAGPGDVSYLAQLLPKKVLLGNYIVPMKQFNHIDFLWGKHAPELVYKQLLKVISNYTVV